MGNTSSSINKLMEKKGNDLDIEKDKVRWSIPYVSYLV